MANSLRHSGFRFRVSLCLSLIIVGCATSQTTVPSPAPESLSAETEATSELSAPSSQTTNSSTPPSTSAPFSTVEEEALWTQLREADEETYVVLLRHAIAPGTGDPANFQLDDCSTQRNLSDVGRQQAREIGKAFRDRNIPVTKVLSSQWCRCLETAELMDIAPVEPFSPLNSFFRDRSTAESQTAQVKDYVVETEAA